MIKEGIILSPSLQESAPAILLKNDERPEKA